MGKRNIKSIQSFFSNSGILKPFSTLIADGEIRSENRVTKFFFLKIKWEFIC